MGGCSPFRGPTAKVSFGLVLLTSSGVTRSRLWRELAVGLWPEIYMPWGLAALLWRRFSLVARMRALLLKFCLFPLRTHFVSLSLYFPFSVSKPSTRFLFPFAVTGLVLLPWKSPAFTTDFLWFSFQPNLLGAALNKQRCTCFKKEIHKMHNADSIFLAVSGMKPALLRINPGTWLLITCPWLHPVQSGWNYCSLFHFFSVTSTTRY